MRQTTDRGPSRPDGAVLLRRNVHRVHTHADGDLDKSRSSAPRDHALMATTPNRGLGDEAEQLVADALLAAGWTMLGRNVRVGRDELDLVAVDPGPPSAVVVVEVRRRGRRDFGLAEETLDWRKRRALRRAIATLRDAGRLPDGTPLPDLGWRFDLVAVEPDGLGGFALRHHRGLRP